jgi:hypothetical protein
VVVAIPSLAFSRPIKGTFFAWRSRKLKRNTRAFVPGIGYSFSGSFKDRTREIQQR